MTYSYYYGERKETIMSVRFEQVSLSAWDKTNAYQIGTKVKYGDVMYVAKKDVPKGINIGMSDYWKKMDDLSSLDTRVDTLETNVGAIATCITTEVSDTPVVFQFAYQDGVYGFMVGETFHPFGGEVAPTNGEG